MKRTSDFLGLVIRLLVIVAIVAVGLIFYQTCAGSPLIQRVDEMEPDVSKAPYSIPTMTYDYVAEYAVKNTDGSVTMRNYYVFMEKKWQYREKEITLPKVLRPEVKRR